MSEHWLPGLMLFADHDGDWNRYLEAVYEAFAADFLKSQPFLEGRRCGCKRYPVIHGKEGTFWHLISEGKVEEERTPDLRRCERIKWPRAMVEHFSDVCIWVAERNGDKRVHIALSDFSYVLVLADRETYLLIWTAFFVEQEHRRRKLKREYERYVLAKKG